MSSSGSGARGALLLAPSVGLTVVVLGAGVGSVILTSVGLLPLFGAPRLSTDGYAAAAPDLIVGARESLLIAAAATALALLVGIATALALLRAAPVNRWLSVAVAGVIPIPHLVGAASVGLLLSGGGVLSRLLGADQSAWPEFVGGDWPIAVVLEFAWKESAFVAVVVLASTSSALADLSDTARMLGAGARQRLLRVTLPLAAPAAVAAGLIVFVYTVGSYEVTWLLGRSYPEALPVMAYRLYTSIDLSARPQAAATATTAIALSVAAAGATIPLLARLGATR